MFKKPSEAGKPVDKNAASPSEPNYYMENGTLVFTATFLKSRGFCCGSGCRHCPYDYKNVTNQ